MQPTEETNEVVKGITKCFVDFQNTLGHFKEQILKRLELVEGPEHYRIIYMIGVIDILLEATMFATDRIRDNFDPLEPQ